MLNYESARAWRQRSTHPALLEATGLVFCDDCYKIPVDEAGIYQPTDSDMQAARIPDYPPGFIRAEPRNFHVCNSGQEIAIHVQGEEDGVL